ncbi:hypothetical protein HJG60_011120 [Phyllostomus discolor]|uniref:Uncharacterized protein n=1 Tax=Phyllostomus discolor TaxID=89673 RepID=A0A834A6Y1_9CHIR|nr:hypothetical protein HJG60_011120 [Phyllostomus discolor]
MLLVGYPLSFALILVSSIENKGRSLIHAFFFKVHKFHFLQYTVFYHSKQHLFEQLCDQDVPLSGASSPSTGWPLAARGPVSFPNGATLLPGFPSLSPQPGQRSLWPVSSLSPARPCWPLD